MQVAWLWSLLCSAAILQTWAEPDIRVAKAHRDRGYNQVRISVVDKGTDKIDDFFDYNKPFQRAWTDYTLHTTIKEVAGGEQTFNIGGSPVKIKLPKEGGRARGLLIADLCFNGKGGGGCSFGSKYWDIEGRFTEAVIALVGSDEIDFWGILGDNFYENNQVKPGAPVSKAFYESLPLSVKAKPFIAVPGNHDFGQYGLGTTAPLDPAIDQGGYGFMQMYAQDVEFALKGTDPFDFSKPIGGDVKDPNTFPTQDNFVTSHQIGDIAFLLWSGVAVQSSFQPYLEKFCKWMEDAPTVNTISLVSHWNALNLGCTALDSLAVYMKAKDMPGCKDKTMVFFDGHEHCNYPHDEAPNNGFLIGGAGQWGGSGGGCTQQSQFTKERSIHQHWGFLIFDSDPSGPQKGNTTRVDYFEVQRTVGAAPPGGQAIDFWQNMSACFKANPSNPYTACREQHSINWRARPEPAPGPGPGPGPTPGDDGDDGGPPIGLIVGIVVAVVAVLLAVGGGVLWRKRQKLSAQQASLDHSQSLTGVS